MKFCSHCGSPRVELRVPEGDNLPRFVCAACGKRGADVRPDCPMG